MQIALQLTPTARLMRKHILILFVFVLRYFSSTAADLTAKNTLQLSENAPQLSEKSTINMLTCSKTNKYIYALFGHSAIRITDEEKQLDLVYNYGTFDNDDPDFYINLIGGKMKYSLSVSTYHSFLQGYIKDQQAVSTQKLYLTLKERNKLFLLLNEQLKPANKYYYYDFIKNNCATKIVDLLAYTIGPDFDNSMAIANRGAGNPVRNLVSNYLTGNALYMIGMNVLLGSKADKSTSKAVNLFLPDTLQKRLGNLQLKERKLAGPATFLFKAEQKENVSQNSFTTAFYSFLLILMLISPFIEKISGVNKLMIWVTVTVFTLISLIGCLLLYLSLFSSLELVKYNLNMLWCHPFYLLVFFKKLNKPLSVVFLGSILLFIMLYFKTMSFPVMLPVLVLLIVLLSFNHNASASHQVKSVNPV
ncbi:lipoprotein N-acyltransferase Lnb domain-containing protein [Pedobacter cryoconitis]|uniref:Uncharacterized protein DUF4105 n=1 Tax=Pedobacter cryoconitis TaxID=188932 RepID=A0A327SSI0_9SPHI|nr:DUF4105 domain-containing protein [Pedobacter cryoconitis]RAJ31881.1 uncharacterized protein DUF4105 [Pedobacter cryoconitis]